ncbi:hypothetical protein BY458DRAFT_491621 [Sporodiniella umbellata]|nr:hypothetical protein BY458DRAFT_491621 [Sporodiniella umbellata]
MAGLKIDFLALNTKNGFEVAFAACEVSKDTMKSKLFHDNSKFYLNTLDFMHILTGQKLLVSKKHLKKVLKKVPKKTHPRWKYLKKEQPEVDSQRKSHGRLSKSVLFPSTYPRLTMRIAYLSLLSPKAGDNFKKTIEIN